MKNSWKKQGAIVLAGLMLWGSGMTACAEEINPAGYHVYDVCEDEVADTWYATARGTYLKAGTSKITHGDEDGDAVCSGHTIAQTSCDRVYVRIYLDESDNGTGGWGTIDYWTGETHELSVASAGSGQYEVTEGKYYRVRGTHSVTEGETTETTDTCTDALLF